MLMASHDTGIDEVGRRFFAIGRLDDEAGRNGYAGRARGGFVAEALVEGPVRCLAAAGAVARGFAAGTLVWRESLRSRLAAASTKD